MTDDVDATLGEFLDNNPPDLHPTRRLYGPQGQTIGHLAFDKARSVSVGMFPRKKDEHWFRGNSQKGLTGYGLSETVIERLAVLGADYVAIFVRDEGEVVEYHRQDFDDGTLVGYDPVDNCALIGADAVEASATVLDRQRVLPVDDARNTFERDDVRVRDGE